MNAEDRHYLACAIDAARAAGALHLYYRGQDLEVTAKGHPTDLVTRVDREAERAIRDRIRAQFPQHAVLGEEGGQDRESRFRWIVDPLDGTTNYAHGFPFSCVSVALEIDGTRRVGVIFDPQHDELFTAVRGGGAWMNGRPLQVSAQRELSGHAMLATGFPPDAGNDPHYLAVFAEFLRRGVSVRRPGSAALGLSYVACGRLDGFWDYRLKAWDLAAGLLILEEAGGRHSGLGGAASEYGRPVIASNGWLHDALLEVIR
ncbi:myo-inositol-1(or 4)-monophosphatase [Deinobacterium chartae]|uniref:Inositol-1-monophosphatase n=1 Tax=Deinobacterium chartae TaxID=521158 RepID=A0A841I7T1_9DEIO|nr:inositol monophosphatase family protein [Deinobacterium chartae]MBB6099865.1 myo-inositol-1(or 4)-monophosphatase [Deinobacterium chartae]